MREDGTITISDPSADTPILQLKTAQCVHCSAHFAISGQRLQTGKTRFKMGWCMSCSGPVCSEQCGSKCIPIDLWLENIEKGRPEYYRPVISHVPCSI